MGVRAAQVLQTQRQLTIHHRHRVRPEFHQSRGAGRHRILEHALQVHAHLVVGRQRVAQPQLHRVDVVGNIHHERPLRHVVHVPRQGVRCQTVNGRYRSARPAIRTLRTVQCRARHLRVSRHDWRGRRPKVELPGCDNSDVKANNHRIKICAAQVFQAQSQLSIGDDGPVGPADHNSSTCSHRVPQRPLKIHAHLIVSRCHVTQPHRDVVNARWHIRKERPISCEVQVAYQCISRPAVHYSHHALGRPPVPLSGLVPCSACYLGVSRHDWRRRGSEVESIVGRNDHARRVDDVAQRRVVVLGACEVAVGSQREPRCRSAPSPPAAAAGVRAQQRVRSHLQRAVVIAVAIKLDLDDRAVNVGHVVRSQRQRAAAHHRIRAVGEGADRRGVVDSRDGHGPGSRIAVVGPIVHPETDDSVGSARGFAAVAVSNRSQCRLIVRHAGRS